MMEHPEYATSIDEAAVQCCKGILIIDESVGKEGLDVKAIFKRELLKHELEEKSKSS